MRPVRVVLRSNVNVSNPNVPNENVPNANDSNDPNVSNDPNDYAFVFGLPRGFLGGLSSAFSRISAATSAPFVSGFFFGFG